MNYFNYFTEIEDTFIRRRGKHLLLSSLDWALIESWKEMGVPLYVALRGIEHAFDSFDAKPRRRSVKTLMYCQEEVEAQYAEWRESQIGAGSSEETCGSDDNSGAEVDGDLPFPRASILAHLDRATDELERLLDTRKHVCEDDYCDTLSRIVAQLHSIRADFATAAHPNAERLEDSLTSLEKMLDLAFMASLDPGQLEVARTETKAQLSSYRKGMDKEMYKQTFDNLLLKRLRERGNIPRLSLFYL